MHVLYGLYRFQTLNPKSHDGFIGVRESGSVLMGPSAHEGNAWAECSRLGLSRLRV